MAASIQSAPQFGEPKQIAYISRAGIEKILSIETFLDDAAPGWKSRQEFTPLPTLTNSEETAIIKAALHRADIHPKRVRHYHGPVIITMDRPEKYEGEFLQIETLAWEALDAAPNARNLCSGIHVFIQFHGKLASGYGRFRRCK